MPPDASPATLPAMTTHETTPPPRGPGATRAVVVTALAALTVAGTAAAIFGRVEHRANDTHTFPAADGFAMTSGSADVTITAADVAEVQVTRDATWSGPHGVPAPVMEGGEVRVHGCGGAWWRSFGLWRRPCDARFEVRVPQGTAVRLTTNAGDVTLAGRLGDVTIDGDVGTLDMTRMRATSTRVRWDVGDVRLSATTPRQDVRASVGSVRGDGLTSQSVLVEANVGDVRLQFVRAPRVVDARANIGGVAVLVPTGRYRVDAAVDVGKSTVDNLTVDRHAPRSITARADVGDVEVKGVTR